jgi:hypothetical protein
MLNSLGPSIKGQIQHEQFLWESNANHCSTTADPKDCLKQVYKARIKALSGQLPSYYDEDRADLTKPAPLPLAPATGAVLSDFPRYVTFRWASMADAKRYGIEIDVGQPPNGPPWYSELYGHVYLENNLTETYYGHFFPGAQPGRWRVWAIFADGKLSQRSEWITFRYAH